MIITTNKENNCEQRRTVNKDKNGKQGEELKTTNKQTKDL